MEADFSYLKQSSSLHLPFAFCHLPFFQY